MDMNRLTKPAPHPHPHLLSTPMIPLLPKNPQLWGGGGEVGKSSVCSWVTASRSEPQGAAQFTLNGKQV